VSYYFQFAFFPPSFSILLKSMNFVNAQAPLGAWALLLHLRKNSIVRRAHDKPKIARGRAMAEGDF
jgi:hypothetical protein